MPRNSTGVYTLPLPPVIAGEIIEAVWANSTMNDIGQALTDSLDRNGRGGMLAPFFFTDGTVGNPGAAWANAPGTGLYRTPSLLGFSWSGAQIFSYAGNGLTLAATKEAFSSTAPSVGDSLTNKTYVDALVAAVPIGNYLPLTGGTISGNLAVTGTLTRGGNTVWDTGNFNPANYAALGANVSFAQVNCTVLVSSGNVNTAGASYAGNWFRVTTGATGLFSDVNANGVQLNAGRVDIYNATYLGAPTILATGAVYSYYSDDRLKTRVMPIGGACARLARLDAFLYRRNELAQSFGYADDGEYMGLSAQQVKREFPQAVALAPFDVGEHGVSKSGENYLTIDYANLVPALVAAVKELTARLDLIEQPLR